MKKVQWVATFVIILSMLGCAKVNETSNVTDVVYENTEQEQMTEMSEKDYECTEEFDVQLEETEEQSVLIESDIEEIDSNMEDTETQENESVSTRENQVFENEQYSIMYTMLSVGATEIEKVKNDNVKIAFPKFRYQKGHELYNTDIQGNINKQIQQLCIEADKDVIYSDYSTESEEHGYNLNYKITKAEDEYFSVKYEGQFTSRKYSMDIARGITIDTLTGEKIPVSDYVYIDVELYDNFVSGDVKFESVSGYGREALVDHLEEFISNYLEGYVDEYTCFYIEDKTVSVIVPVHSGTSSYFEMKFDL